MVAVTFADYEIASQLAPIVRERYPGLGLMVAVGNEADTRRFDAPGIQAVAQQGFPRGPDMAAAVLDAHHVGKGRIHDWMARLQAQELTDSVSGQLAMDVSN